MNGNSIGKAFVITSFGESHGPCIGVIVDGCPPGLSLNEDDIQRELDKRRPGSTFVSTQRREEDKIEILSGLYRGRTTGAPICLLIRNIDVNSESYEEIKRKPRPGHADYPAYIKYGGYNDHRGGGRFSGRITACLVAAGAIAKKLIGTLGIEVLAHVVQIGRVRVKEKISYEDIRRNVYSNPVRCALPEYAALMEKEVIEAANDGDSVGGVVEGVALNVPCGIGEPIFDSLDSDIAKMMFNIPAVKGVEFGAGFNCTLLRGSENNDPYILRDGKIITMTNNAGGILGGISTGMPIVVRVAFKPTPSISKTQRTVDLKLMEEAELKLHGRFDPCIVPRAVPVVESCLAIVLADHIIRSGMITKVIGE
ncbi:MAG: chorismate synthase [Nitrososphaerota archaeon]|nr:chorismate synthase [Candidatus Bathyarchaeota archaeon]MDW8048480.1 chorismate synthase [Nitrososphaerota archaeon]